MRTTVDIPLSILEDVRRFSGEKTRRRALIVALEDYLRRKRLERVVEAAGTLDFDMDIKTIRDLDNRQKS